MSDSLPRRVVLTGLGLVTPLGLDLDAIWRALIEGRGLRYLSVEVYVERVGVVR